MVTKKKRLALMVGEAFAAASLLTMSAGVMAQATERVEITGSRITRTDTESAAPVTIITRDDIEKSGMQSVADVIRSLPVDNNGSIPTAFGAGFAAGASAISLRGLGINSTLVLVNGRRVAPYGLADDGQRNFVDLSSIPLDAVDRIEVLKDGASAIYGSDAIGGVVNIILRNTFKGVIANASVGTTRYKDGDNGRANVTAGFGELASDRFNFFFNVEVAKQQAIFEPDRYGRGEITNADVTGVGRDFLEGQIRGFLIPGTAISGGWGGAVRSPAGGFNYKFLPCLPGTGTFSAAAVAQYPGLLANASTGFGGPAGCPSNAFDYYQVQPKEERANLFGRGTFQLSPAWQAYAEASRYSTNVSNFYTPSSVSSAWPDIANFALKNNAGITIGAAHPDNPFPGTNNRLRYFTADLGGRNNTSETVATRYLVGAKGKAGGWELDFGVLYSQSESDLVRTGYVRDSVLRDYLMGTNLSGQNPTLTFYRLGVNAGLNSAATRAAISPDLKNHTETSVKIVDAKATRELMQLAGGPLGLAIGAEWREEKLDSPAVPFTDTADIVGLGFAAFKAERKVSAVFAEVAAPFTKTLEASAAVRFDKYSDVGSSTTPKLGLKWKPVKPLLLRTTYSEAFRAPGAAESGNSSSAGFVSGVPDPILCPNGTPVPTATNAQCALTLIIASVGNPQIKPETAKSWTLGGVWEPWESTSLSLDVWKFVRKNEITQPDVPSVTAGRIPGGQSIRFDDGSGAVGPGGEFPLAGVIAPYFNSSSTTTNGFDVDFRQRFKLSEYGRLTATVAWTHLNRFTRVLQDGTSLDYAGSHGPTALSGNGGMPKNRWTGGLTWDMGGWSTTARVNYVGSFKNKETAKDTDCLNHDFDGADFQNCEIKSFTTVDLFVKWTAQKDLEVYGSIRNLFDKVSPYDPQVYSAFNYNPIYHLAGAIGRQFNVGLKYKFK